jgi:hypothetical protein
MIMALQIKGKFIEASTLDGERVLLKWDANDKGGALRFEDSSENVLELVSYDEGSSKVIFKDAAGNEEEYVFASELFENDSEGNLRLKSGIMPSNVMLESEFIEDQSGTKVVKEGNISSAITRDSEVFEASGDDAGKFKESLMPAGVMLNSEFTELEGEVRVIKEENIAAAIARDSEVLLRSDFLAEDGRILKAKLEIPDDVVTEAELYNSDGSGGTTGIIQDSRLAASGVNAIARESSVLLKADYVDGSGILNDAKLPAGLARDSEIFADPEAANLKIKTSLLPALAISNTNVVADIAARNALTTGSGDDVDVQEGDIVIVTGTKQTFIWDGSEYKEVLTPATVTSVNGETGTVILTTSDISEGTNLYLDSTNLVSKIKQSQDVEATEDEENGLVALNLKSSGVTAGSYGAASKSLAITVDAQGRLTSASAADISITASQVSDFATAASGAVVGDAIADGETAKAPSQNAVFDALALKANDSVVVKSVNGVSPTSGAVSIDTSHVAEELAVQSEGEFITNAYFTNARARAAITGAASSIASADLTASKALASDASGKVVASAVTAVELGYVSGVTSAIQTQMDAKAAKAAVNTAVNALHKKQSFEITASLEQTIALDAKPAVDSMVASVGRLLLQEGVDYDIEETSAGSGSWQLALKGSVASGGEEALEEGDVVYMKYMKELALA